MSKRLLYENVKKEVESGGLQLMSVEYVNLKTELEVQCELEHRFFRTLRALRKSRKCPVCDANSLHKQNIGLNDSAIIKKKKDVFRALALDNATYTTGYAIFDDGQLVYYNTISVGGTDAVQRIARVRQWLVSMVEKWEPDIVGLENVQLQQNPQIFKILAQLLGVLENTLFEMKVKYYIIESAAWKSYSGIKGKNRALQKQSAQQYIMDHYGIRCTEDESDAILLGKCLAEQNAKRRQLIHWEQ